MEFFFLIANSLFSNSTEIDVIQEKLFVSLGILALLLCTSFLEKARAASGINRLEKGK